MGKKKREVGGFFFYLFSLFISFVSFYFSLFIIILYYFRLEQYPILEDEIDELIPKKQPLFITKCQNRISMVVIDSVPLFFQERDGPFYPTLRLLHKYPDLLPHMQVDRGAVKFVLSKKKKER